MNNSKTPNPDPTYPLAYTEQETWFYGRKFLVTPATLIPRPETEAIIDAAKFLYNNHFSAKNRTFWLEKRAQEERKKGECVPFLIADIGTGTGIIPITLALELPQATITATDISPSALQVARQNTLHHEAQINFMESDLLSSITSKFDIITANLPYVDKNWHWLDHQALSHEPAEALFADDHGLALIKKLIAQAPPHLNPRGALILEHDPCQLPALTTFAAQHGFTSTPHSPYVTILTRTK